MEETEGEFPDETTYAEEQADEEYSTKAQQLESSYLGEGFSDYKPFSTPSASSDESNIPRHQTWSKLVGLPGEEGLWATAEQELVGESYSRETLPEEPCKSETEETVTEDSQLSREGSATSSEALSNVYSKLSPFNIQWSFGTTRNTEIINLTMANSFEVFYVSGHFGVIYNYGTDIMKFLPGHNYPITSIAADTTGRWLVTADAGEDTVIIIWDRKRDIPVWSLYNVFPDEGVRRVGISQDARFLAAVNCNLPHKLKFWLWTYGREEADGAVEIETDCGQAKHIDFNHRNTEQFVLTMEFGVTFCEWVKETKTLEKNTQSLDTRKKKLGILRESIFLDDNHTVLSSTSQGYIVVWSDVKYTEVTDPEIPGKIQRDFLKALRFHKTGIVSLRLCDGIVATGSEDGTIFFHDQQCRLVYCTPQMQVDPLVSISFNLEHIPCSADPFSTRPDSKWSEYEEVQNVLEYDASDEMQNPDVSVEGTTEAKRCVDIPDPRDCTFDMKPIFVRDFVFLTTLGKMAYMSHRRGKVKYYLYEIEAPILSMDCSPTKPHLAIGNSQGRLSLFEHNLKKRLLTVMYPSGITTLQYSSFGHILMAGFQNGQLLGLDALLLTVKFKLETSKSAIGKLCFSQKDEFLAYYDNSSTVHVYKKKMTQDKWITMGKYTSHYKPIVDILFAKDKDDAKMSRLFTIGQDRMLVEYEMKIQEENRLKIRRSVRIEQTAIPLCFISTHTLYNSPHFLFSNDQYKLKVVDGTTLTCKKTTLGPTADTPIKYMKMIKQTNRQDNERMIYTTDKHIGIRLLPPTGNPFEGLGMVAHTDKLAAVAVSHDQKYIFTVGVNDMSPLMWELNLASVDVACQLGGKELEPFASLIEGGPNSFLFKELEDFYYYAQIIHQGEDPNIDRSVSKKLALCEVPDLFRALGYYPTDYEVNNLLHELKHLNYEETGQIRTEITFEECVKAFLNHRPVEATSLTDINNALLAIADLSDPSDIIIERDELYSALEHRAEGMEHAEALGYMCILLLPKDENNPVPHNLRLNEFAETVLGIDLTITEKNVRQITHAFENH